MGLNFDKVVRRGECWFVKEFLIVLVVLFSCIYVGCSGGVWLWFCFLEVFQGVGEVRLFVDQWFFCEEFFLVLLFVNFVVQFFESFYYERMKVF